MKIKRGMSIVFLFFTNLMMPFSLDSISEISIFRPNYICKINLPESWIVDEEYDLKEYNPNYWISFKKILPRNSLFPEKIFISFYENNNINRENIEEILRNEFRGRTPPKIEINDYFVDDYIGEYYFFNVDEYGTGQVYYLTRLFLIFDNVILQIGNKIEPYEPRVTLFNELVQIMKNIKIEYSK
jgi:hypothetical protein